MRLSRTEATAAAHKAAEIVVPSLTTALMPTKRRRHAIPKTPPVQAALDELGEALGSERVEMGELVILGAQQKLARL